MQKARFCVSLSVNRRHFKIGPFAQRRKPTTDEKEENAAFFQENGIDSYISTVFRKKVLHPVYS